MSILSSDHYSAKAYTTKVSEVTLVLWVIKIAATTLGETAKALDLRIHLAEMPRPPVLPPTGTRSRDEQHRLSRQIRRPGVDVAEVVIDAICTRSLQGEY
jgi:hypothetical protein